MSVFVTSDTHFGDERLITTSRKKYGFKSVEEMDQYIIDQWNKTVGKNDTVIHLGDVIGPYDRCDDSFYRRLFKVQELNGRIILVKGNYDERLTKEQIYNAGFSDIAGDELQIGEILFTHHPQTNAKDSRYNVHGHTHAGALQELLERSNFHFNAMGELWDFRPVKINDSIDAASWVDPDEDWAEQKGGE